VSQTDDRRAAGKYFQVLWQASAVLSAPALPSGLMCLKLIMC
jgi:hypothetical protein